MRPDGFELTSVYVHFPWCLKKCPYCDFATRAIERAAVPQRGYADAVRRELEGRAASFDRRSLMSVFFGGGTPSLWDASELGRVLADIRAAFPAEEPELEVTVECNPSSLDRDRVAALRDHGVNRISIGVQSFDDSHLTFLGRRHDSALAVRAVEGACAEISRVSADLMFGMPGQTVTTFLGDVDRLVALGVGHVSAYALTLEPGTLFGQLARLGKLEVESEDRYAELFEAARARFSEHGLAHYEVSNYARPGEEAQHNLHYWRGGAYVGLGAAAVGCLDQGPGSALRWKNEADPMRYMASPGAGAEEEALGPDEIVREAFLLGLRTREGVDLVDASRRAGVDPLRGRDTVLRRRVGAGDLCHEDGRLRVPLSRWLHLDGIVADLF